MKKAVLSILLSTVIILGAVNVQSIPVLRADTETKAERVETSEDSDTPEFSTVAETTKAPTLAEDINVYKTESESGEIKAKQEKKRMYSGTLLVVIMFLGLLLGGAGGYALGWYLHKRKIDHEHDTIYNTIRQGEVHEALRSEKAAIEKERLAQQKKKEMERQKALEQKKEEKQRKRDELLRKKNEEERLKKLKKIQQLQKDLGYDASDDLGYAAFEKETGARIEEEEPVEETIVESPFLEEKKSESDLSTKEEKIHSSKPKKRFEPIEEKPEIKKVEKIRPEDMIYGGTDDDGEAYYYDPEDEEGEPFRIEDGRKVFYDDEEE